MPRTDEGEVVEILDASTDPAAAPVGARPARRGQRAVLAAVLIALGLGLALVGSPMRPRARVQRGADGTAFRGLAWLLHEGRVSGRDFAAAYGAVPQALARAGVALRGGNDWAGALPAIYLVMCAVSWVLLVLWIALLPGVGWGVRLGVAAAALAIGWPWAFSFLRPAAALLAARGCAELFREGPASGGTARVLVAAAGTAAVALVSFDFVVYLLAAVVSAALLGLAPGPWRVDDRPRLVRRLLGYGVAVASALLGLSALASATAVASGVGPLEPLRSTLELALTYPQTFGLPWAGALGESLVWALVVLSAATLSLLAARRAEGHPLRALLLLLAPLSLLALKGAMVRSDAKHIGLGLAPALLLLALVSCSDGARRRAWRGAGVVVVLAAIFLYPGRPVAAKLRLIQSWNPARAWSEMRERQPAEGVFPAHLVATAARSPDAPLAVFPLQIGLAALAGRPLVATVDQLYAAHTPAMQRRVVRDLERAGPGLEVVYGLDGLSTWAVDGVPSIARSPVVFEYLLEGFRARPARLLDDGYLLLARRSRKRRLQWHDVGAGPLAPTADGSAWVSRFASPRGCALMRAELVFRYPPERLLGWPAGASARLWAGHRLVLSARLVPLEVGRRFVIDLSPLAGRRFARLFLTRGRPRGPRVDRLELVPADGGPFGVAVRAFELGAVRCLG